MSITSTASKLTETPAVIREKSGPLDYRASSYFEDETGTVGWRVVTARNLRGELVSRADAVRFERVSGGILFERSFPGLIPSAIVIRHSISRLTRKVLVSAHDVALEGFRAKLAAGEVQELHPSL